VKKIQANLLPFDDDMKNKQLRSCVANRASAWCIHLIEVLLAYILSLVVRRTLYAVHTRQLALEAHTDPFQISGKKTLQINS